MALEAVAPVGLEQALRAVAKAGPPEGTQVVSAPGGEFSAWFAREVGAVNGGLVQAEASMRAMALGQGGNLHEVMIQLEEAKLSFQLLAQVRNRVLEAYQEVMRTQV